MKRSYEWLEDNLTEVEQAGDLQDERIYLNVDDPVRDEWNWLPASGMALDTQDLAVVSSVRGFLQNYRKLLKATGVLEASYPELQTGVDDSHLDDQLSLIRVQFASMRDSGHFTDVTLLSNGKNGTVSMGEHSDMEVDAIEDADVGDPNSLHGHRVWLSAVNTYFKDMFSPGSGFVESQATASGTLVRIPLPYSRYTLKVVLGERKCL